MSVHFDGKFNLKTMNLVECFVCQVCYGGRTIAAAIILLAYNYPSI